MKETYLQWLLLCKCHVGVLRGLHGAPGAHHEVLLTRDIKVMLKLLFKGADITHIHSHIFTTDSEEQLFWVLREQREETIPVGLFRDYLYAGQFLQLSFPFD